MDRITAIIKEIHIQQQIFSEYEPTADLIEMHNRNNNEKSVVLVDRITELEAGIEVERVAGDAMMRTITELEATIYEVVEFQKQLQRDADWAEGRMDDVQQERQKYATELLAILEKK